MESFDRDRALAVYHETTAQLIEQLLEETGIPSSATDFHCFRELVVHLNPLAEIPNTSSSSQVPDYTPTQTNVMADCIVCHRPTPTYRSVSLNVSEAVKVLMAAVMDGGMTIEYARRTVCQHPLKICTSHLDSVYEMMKRVIGAKTAREVNDVPMEKLQECLELYKNLKRIRDKMDGKPLSNTPIGSFKIAIKSFYNSYVPKHVKNAELKNSRVSQILASVSPSTSLKDVLTNSNINLTSHDEVDLLEAMRKATPNISEYVSQIEMPVPTDVVKRRNRIRNSNNKCLTLGDMIYQTMMEPSTSGRIPQRSRDEKKSDMVLKDPKLEDDDDFPSNLLMGGGLL